MNVPPLHAETRRWLEYALSDLEIAEHVARSGDFAPHIGCFHAQQSGEKALKAILVFLQIPFSFSHDLNLARNLIPPGWSVRQPHLRFAALSQWAVQGRYPGNWPEATDADCRLAAQQGREIWETVIQDLEQHGFDVSPFR